MIFSFCFMEVTTFRMFFGYKLLYIAAVYCIQYHIPSLHEQIGYQFGNIDSNMTIDERIRDFLR